MESKNQYFEKRMLPIFFAVDDREDMPDSRTSNGKGGEQGDDEQKPRKLDIIFYLQRVISEKVPELEDQNNNNFLRATKVTKTLLGIAMTQDPYFQRHFIDVDTLQPARAKVVSVDKTKFACHVYLKRFTIPNTFETICGLQHCFPPGYAMYKISDKLTHEEKLTVKSKWSYCLDSDGYLTAQKMFSWFLSGISNALKRLTGEDDKTEDSDLKNTTLLPTYPNVTLQISGENEDQEVLTIQIIPAVKGTGWPYGVRLQNPMPHREPYCSHGKQYMKRIESEMEDGQSMWFLEGQSPSLPKTLGNAKMFQRLLKNPEQSSRLWKLSFLPAENHMLQCLREYKDSNCDAVLQIFRVIAAKQSPIWDILDPNVLNVIMLWYFKKNAAKLKSMSDVFRGMLNSIKTCLEACSCPNFLLPTVNILDTTDKEKANVLASELATLINKLEDDPSYILEYTGCITKRKQDDNEQDKQDATGDTETQ